ncbi:MAG: hypothetical protein AB2693_28370 [Candidatus Thiodiazotropha sp.]
MHDRINSIESSVRSSLDTFGEELKSVTENLQETKIRVGADMSAISQDMKLYAQRLTKQD